MGDPSGVSGVIEARLAELGLTCLLPTSTRRIPARLVTGGLLVTIDAPIEVALIAEVV